MQKDCNEKENIIRQQNKTIFDFSEIRQSYHNQEKTIKKLKQNAVDEHRTYDIQMEKLQTEKDLLEETVLQYQKKVELLEHQLGELISLTQEQKESVLSDSKEGQEIIEKKELKKEEVVTLDLEDKNQDKKEPSKIQTMSTPSLSADAQPAEKKKKIKVRVHLPEPAESKKQEEDKEDFGQDDKKRVLEQKVIPQEEASVTKETAAHKVEKSSRSKRSRKRRKRS